MTRLRAGVAVLVVSILATGWLLGADEKKPDEPKAKGFLPQNWGKICLTTDQKQDVYKIQAKYNADIDKLKAKIDALKAEEKVELEKVLTEDQKKKLKEIKTGEKPSKESREKAIQDAKAALARAEQVLADTKDEAKKKELEKVIEAAKSALKKAEDAAKDGK